MSSVLSGNIFNIAKLDQTIGQIKNIVTFVKKNKTIFLILTFCTY